MPHSEGPVPQVQAKEGPMPQLVKKRRLGWAVLAVGALIASLFAVGASPAAAIDDKSKPDRPASSTACLGAAAESQGFSDVMDGDEFAHAIDCLAYYGISKGTGDGSTFSPNDTVSRWQMAVFLARAARLMGVDIGAEYDMDMMDEMGMDDMSGDMDDMHMSAAGFSDLGSVASWIGHEIDNVVKAGVMSGDNSHFYPDDAMSRVDMAVALVALVDKASTEVSTDRSGLFRLGTGTTSEAPNDSFDDVRMGYPAHIDRAVSVAYELGITSGVGDGTSFDPSGSVTRGQMAAFITRAMDHTGLRPAGVTAQAYGSDIVVSVRDANLAPVTNAAIDGFWVDNAQMSRAFRDDGTCGHVMALELETNVCEIDKDDKATGANGDVSLSGPATIGDSGVTVWVWSGAAGAKFSSTDTAAFEMELTKEAVPSPGVMVRDSTDLAKDAQKARYGSTVHLNIQLIDAKGAATGVGAGDWSLSVVVKLHAGDDPKMDSVYSQETIELALDASGAASIPLTASDPNPSSAYPATTGSDTSAVSYEITPTMGEDVQAKIMGQVFFSDEEPDVTTVSVDVGSYHTDPGPTSGAGVTATVSVLDQYGAAMSGVEVRLSSNQSGKSKVPSRERVTGRDGTVRISYTHEGSGMGHAEMLTAKYGTGPCEQDIDKNPIDGGTQPCGRAHVYWVEDAMDGSEMGGLLTIDTDRNAVILNKDTSGANNNVRPVRAIYDSNDQFRDGSDDDAISIDDFERLITTDLAAMKKGTVEWASYEADDRSDVAVFTYTPAPAPAG